MDATTVGQRVYLVRLAQGDGVRKAMPMREFADLVSMHASRVSDIENDKSPPTLDEVERIAAIDPRRRGRDWLGWGATEGAGSVTDEPANGHEPPASPPPLEMFKRLETGDDLRDGLGEPRAEKKKRGNGRHEAS